MTEGEWEDEGKAISIFEIGTLLLRNRWRVARWAVAGALVALALVWTRPALNTGETERDVMGTVRALQGDKTLVIVAHRLSTVAHCDRLFRLEQGCVVEEGGADAMLAVGSRMAGGVARGPALAGASHSQ